METIKNYLESMFLSLPNTPEVQKAKYELGQMMEDKYTELRNEGKAENEAVGIVISEFGNLEELAEDLGIRSFLNRGNTTVTGRTVTLEEAKKYIAEKGKESFMVALGVLLCITSPVGTILFDCIAKMNNMNRGIAEAIGVTLLFSFIAVAVGLFIYAGVRIRNWDFLKREPCNIDFATAEYVHNQRENYKANYALLITVGVILCIMSVVPSAVIGCLNFEYGFIDDFSGALVLIFVAIGVLMFIIAGGHEEAYKNLLKLNDVRTVGGNYVPSQKDGVRYSNRTVAALMSVYWPTITCIYLCWSFLSFDWHMTWIIWPVAGVVSSLIKNLFGDNMR